MALPNRDADAPQNTVKKARKIITSDPLAIIYEEDLWRISKVTPMYGLQYLPKELKMYATQIKKAIVSTVPGSSSAKYSVKVEELPHLKYSEEDCSGLKISVTSSKSSKCSKDAYLAILLSWSVNIKVDDSTHLPYMLERGELRIGNAVKSIWKNLFDCNIKQFTFSQPHVLQFGFNFAEVAAARANDPFRITYKTSQDDQKEKLTLTFDVVDINIIWNGLKDQEMNTDEMVKLTYYILQKQICHSLSLDVTVFDVVAISLPGADIRSDGVAKMKTPDFVNSFFTVLNHISSVNMEMFAKS